MRISDLLMRCLREHPELKDAGVPEMLMQMEYWDVPGSLVEEQAGEHPEKANGLMKDYIASTHEWARW